MIRITVYRINSFLSRPGILVITYLLLTLDLQTFYKQIQFFHACWTVDRGKFTLRSQRFIVLHNVWKWFKRPSAWIPVIYAFNGFQLTSEIERLKNFYYHQSIITMLLVTSVCSTPKGLIFSFFISQKICRLVFKFVFSFLGGWWCFFAGSNSTTDYLSRSRDLYSEIWIMYEYTVSLKFSAYWWPCHSQEKLGAC